jgi:hypothetical protein
VEIRLASGEVVTEPASVPLWRESREGAVDLGREGAEPVTAEELLAEEHHRIYGRPGRSAARTSTTCSRASCAPTCRCSTSAAARAASACG